MNEVLSDTDNPSHLHLDLESNIFFLQKTYLPNYRSFGYHVAIGLPSPPEEKVPGEGRQTASHPHRPKQMRDQQPRWPRVTA